MGSSGGHSISEPSGGDWQRLYSLGSKRRNQIPHGNRDRSISQTSGYPFIVEGFAIGPLPIDETCIGQLGFLSSIVE
jgi:hypothetical protein